MALNESDYNHLPQTVELEWVPYWNKTDTLVSMRVFGRYPVKVQDFWVPAVEAFEHQMNATNYENPCDYIGSFFPRNITGTDWWSTHSYGGTMDWDYGGDNPESPDHPGVDNNPHLHREIVDSDYGNTIQLSKANVEAVLAIRTMNGKLVWRWLGSIGDSMHFEPACSPDDIRTGIDPTSLIGGDPMGCPWTVMATDDNKGVPWRTTYPPCENHYLAHEPIEWGVNTGVCNVEWWNLDATEWAIADGIFKLTDNRRDDLDQLLTYGNYITLQYRQLGG